MQPFRCFSFTAILLTTLSHEAIELVSAAESKPVLLYSRCFNAKGESRYLPDGTFKPLLEKLGKEFEVRVHDQLLNSRTLAGVSVVLIANPSDKAVGDNPPPHHVDKRDINELTRFVLGGGGLIVMGNQENHNLEVDAMNGLLEHFGLQFTNRFTDAKLLPVPKSTPVIGGLNWGYYTGNQVLFSANHPAKPRALVMNDLSIKPASGDRDEPGALMAASEPGKGRVVLITDSGWLADFALDDRGLGGVVLKGQQNWEIIRRISHWAARSSEARP